MGAVQSIEYKAIRGLNYLSEDGEPFPIGLELRSFNLFVGPNGGGKSSLIDMLRLLKDDGIVPLLSRETHNCSDSFIHIEAGNGSITVKFPNRGEEHGFHIREAIVKVRDHNGDYLVHPYTIRFEHGKQKDGQPTPLGSHLGVRVQYLDCLSDYHLENEAITAVLNSERSLFPQILQYQGFPAAGVQKDRLYLSFEDEAPYLPDGRALPVTSNSVPYDCIPRGWRNAARLLVFINQADNGDVCLIEEPEVALHPTLLRNLFQRVCAISKQKNLQLVISSHSPVLLDYFSKLDDAEIFSAETHQITRWIGGGSIFHNLGARPSDLMMANGIILVEGESDRIYINHWIEEYCTQKGLPLLLEGVDYAVILYGGSLLKYLDIPESDPILSIAHHFIIVIDRDDDFLSENGAEEFIGENQYKNRVLCEAMERGSLVWVTDGSTIESYVNTDLLAELPKSRKVSVARRVVSQAKSKGIQSYNDAITWENRMDGLIKAIVSWKTDYSIKKRYIQISEATEI